jgi:hypothetical protein
MGREFQILDLVPSAWISRADRKFLNFLILLTLFPNAKFPSEIHNSI